MPARDLPSPSNAEAAQPKKVWVTPEIHSQSIQALTLEKNSGTPEADSSTAQLLS